MLLALSLVAVNCQISRQDCIDQGGQVVGDIGNGAIFLPTFLCESNGLPPIDEVIASPGEPIAIEGEVCCGSSDEEDNIDFGMINNTTDIFDREEYTRQECLENNGTVIGDIGNGAIFQEDFICESNGLPPIANILQDTSPFAIEGEVCCGLTDSENGTEIPLANEQNDLDDSIEVTRKECTEDLGGILVGDIGDGATRRDDYVCESTGEPPVAIIVPAAGEPIAREGEVCCGSPTTSTTTMNTKNDTRDDSAASFHGFMCPVASAAALILATVV
jgi:hypothetical protein